MLIKLHSQATTTPKIRAAIQASDEPAWVLAERHGTTEQTVWKWRKRDSVEDRSHMPHRLKTTLTPAQEAVAVELRKTLLVSLDDLLAVVREFLNPDVSGSGLDRCLRRHGVGNLRDLQAKAAREEADAQLSAWFRWARRSKLAPFKKLAMTLKAYWDGILNGFDSALSNSSVEAINGLIQATKARARGYRKARSLILIAYLTVGHLSHLPASPYTTTSGGRPA